MMHTVVTTSWDDGHKLDLRLASLLKKYKIAGTFYISPFDREFTKNELLTKSEIKKLSRNFEIGAHTMTHPHLSKIPLKEAKREVMQSKKYLEQIIHKKVTSFCYPYGDYTKKVVHSIKKQGFTLARTTKRFSFDLGDDPYILPTTTHAYNHLTDIPKILQCAGFSVAKAITYRDWEVLAKDLFINSMNAQGAFHLWGHSWEIEKFKAWGKLENVLSFISKRRNVVYVTNAKLYET